MQIETPYHWVLTGQIDGRKNHLQVSICKGQQRLADKKVLKVNPRYEGVSVELETIRQLHRHSDFWKVNPQLQKVQTTKVLPSHEHDILKIAQLSCCLWLIHEVNYAKYR